MISALINKLNSGGILCRDEWIALIGGMDEKSRNHAAELAQNEAKKHYGNEIFIRGLIEYSNYCSKDCYYCGIRKSNASAARYRLSRQDVLDCCKEGHALGFRSFVLQSGEEVGGSDKEMIRLIGDIKNKFPDCALTLSLGEKSLDTYREFRRAGADRYLLRHETASEEHYKKLHPPELSLENRKRCLYHLKELGFQVGCGFMVGSPYQTASELASDMEFIRDLQPEMVGIGPFIPHKDTVFKDKPMGSLEATLYMLSLTRLLLKSVLLPATTALGSIHPQGREMGILAGANVVMPNLSPEDVRDKYSLYNNKLSTGNEAAENLKGLSKSLKNIGYKISPSRGDWKSKK